MANNITRWNPLREMANMQSMMDRLFDEAWRPFPFGEDVSSFGRTLAMDIYEDGDNFVVVTELPGVRSDEINVRIDGDFLIVEGEIPQPSYEEDGKNVIIQERPYGHFSRRVRLPQAINRDAVQADYEDGLLRLTLPRAEEVKPRQIPIKVTQK
jgi:HSP20 family protein